MFSFFQQMKPEIFANLKVLNLSCNNLGNISFKLASSSLAFINIEKNTLKNLAFLQNCPNLQEIYAANNNIKSLCTDLIKMKSLSVLDLSYNLLDSFDALSLLSFNSQLKFLCVKGNMIENKRDFKESMRKLFKCIQLETDAIIEQVLFIRFS